MKEAAAEAHAVAETMETKEGGAPRASDTLILAGNPAAVVRAIDGLGAVVDHDADPANCIVAGTELWLSQCGR